MPLPLNETTVGELCALLATEREPDVLLTAVGANCTTRLLDCPGARASGKLKPLILNPAPVTVACEILKFAVPELLSITVWLPVVPTVTLPKFTLLGVTESWCFTPLPVMETLVGEFGALLSNETVPDALPVAVGVNCSLRLPDCPAGSVRGKV